MTSIPRLPACAGMMGLCGWALIVGGALGVRSVGGRTGRVFDTPGVVMHVCYFRGMTVCGLLRSVSGRLTSRCVAVMVVLVPAVAGCETSLESPAADSGRVYVADVQACGAFSVIDDLVRESLNTVYTDRPSPEVQMRPPLPGDHVLVGVDALSNIDKRGVSEPLAAALNSYVSAAASLGSFLNHHEPQTAAADMRFVLGRTRGTVALLCEESGWEQPDRDRPWGGRGKESHGSDPPPSSAWRPEDPGGGPGYSK